MMPCQQFICQAFALHLVQVHQEDQCSACWWSRDRASDSLWSLVERCQWDGGAAGPGQNYCLPSTHSKFPLFSGTITTYGYCLLKGDCAFDFAKSWQRPRRVLSESTASVDQQSSTVTSEYFCHSCSFIFLLPP